MIINYKNLSIKDALSEYFRILNTAQPVPSKRLAKSEIQTLVEFLLLPEKFENKRFGSLAKTKVLEALADQGTKITRANLNNKIYSILEKGYLRRDIDSVIYPMNFVQNGLQGIRRAVDTQTNFDITFRFSNEYDNQGSKPDLQNNR